MSSATPGATIHYSTDGSEPTTASSRYEAPILISTSLTVNAIAVAPGLGTSAVSRAEYRIEPPPQVAAPTFTPPAGTFGEPQWVVLATSTPDATLFYTTDGSPPDRSSSRYEEPIAVRSSATIRAIAVRDGFTDSVSVSTVYVIDPVVLEPPAAYHVDSVHGDDANPGSFEQPLRSIGALLAKPLAPGVRVFLARGSYWREMLYPKGTGVPGGLPHGAEVAAYGSGPRPVFDGADVIPAASWTLTSGQTSVYQATIDSSIVPQPVRGGMGNRIWEDWGGGSRGRLLYVPDVATCAATPGSWTGPVRPTGGRDTFYVHASDGSNPATNGKVYEWPARPWGVNGGQYPTDATLVARIQGVKTQRHGHHNGGIITATYVGDFEVDTGGAGTVDPSHGLWCNGVCEDGTTPSTVSYGNDLVAGATWRRVHVTCASSLQGAIGSGTGFFFHTGGVGLYKHGKMLYEDVSGEGCTALLGGDSATQVTILRATALGNDVRRLATYSNVDRLDIVGARWVRHDATDDGNAISANAVGQTVVFGSRLVTNRAAPYALITADAASGPVALIGNTFAFTGSMIGPYRAVLSHRSASAPVVMERNQFVNAYRPLSAAGVSVGSVNGNVYDRAAADWSLGGTAYSFAAWQQSGRDLDSIVEATVVGDLTAGDTRPSGTSAAWTVRAGADAYGDEHALDYILTIP